MYSQFNYSKLKGKYLTIDKYLFGLKTSAARWADTISADTGIWMRKNGDKCDYQVVYVDDFIIAAADPMRIIKYFKGVGVPEYYVGGDVELKENKDGKSQIVISQMYVTK